MSRENIEIVRRLFEGDTRRDAEELLALYHPEVEMEFSRSPFADFMSQGNPRGLDEVRNVFREWYDAWENVETDVDELIDVGEHVVSVFTYRGSGRGSGIAVEWEHMAGVWTIRAGKIVRVTWLRTREDALEAARARE